MNLHRSLASLLALLAVLGASFRAPARTAAAPVAPVTVILVRHAEKAGDDPRDPALSPAGTERAAALARLLARSRPTGLIASEFRRTQATLAPLAKELGLAVETIAAGETTQLLERITRAAPGSTLVVAGHSNTLPALAAALGAPLPNVESGAKGPMLRDDEYDRLFVLHLPPPSTDVGASVLELCYGP